MILWMILSAEAFDGLRRRRYLTGDGRRIERHRSQAYAWMAAEMRRRIGSPPGRVRYPLWAWSQWQGPERARPDLRSIRHYYGGKFVRAEIEVPDDRVLLSDYEAWHYVLNGWYLATSEADADEFDTRLKVAGVPARWPYPQSFHSRVVGSWQRVLTWTRRRKAGRLPSRGRASKRHSGNSTIAKSGP